MKTLFLVLLILGAVIGGVAVKADTVVVREYIWDHPYWHNHHYGNWRHQRGYWAYRHGEHVFITINQGTHELDLATKNVAPYPGAAVHPYDPIDRRPLLLVRGRRSAICRESCEAAANEKKQVA